MTVQLPSTKMPLCMSAKRIIEFDVLRVLAMVGVIYIHSPYTDEGFGGVIITYILRILFPGSVAAFFIMSGYFAAHRINSPEGTFGSYFQEKFLTLAVPYFFWNALVLGLCFVASLLLAGLGISGQGYYLGFDFTPFSVLRAMTTEPIVYQFWFVRDLFFVSLAAYLLCRYLPRVPLLPWFFLLLPGQATFWMGCFLLGYSLYGWVVPERFPPVRASLIACLLWMVLGVGWLGGHIPLEWKVRYIGGAAFLFLLANALAKQPWGGKIAWLGSSVFFVYATHDLVKTVIDRLLTRLGWVDSAGLFIFFITPVLTFPICVLGYQMIRRWARPLLPLMTGGR